VTFLVTVVVELQRNIFKVSLEYLAVKCVKSHFRRCSDKLGFNDV